MKDIHEQNVTLLYEENKKEIEKKRNIFEKHKIITDVVNSFNKQQDQFENTDHAEDEEDEFLETETTTSDELESFEKWAKKSSKKLPKET